MVYYKERHTAALLKRWEGCKMARESDKEMNHISWCRRYWWVCVMYGVYRGVTERECCVDTKLNGKRKGKRKK